MGFLHKTKSVKDKIKGILLNDKRTRDNDQLLIALFWFIEKKNDIHKLNAVDFLKQFSENKMTSPETIRSCRQKLQEEFPELRGFSYKERKKEAQEVTQQINEL